MTEPLREPVPRSRTEGARVPGYDLARGLAVLIMVVLNVTGILASAQSHPHWLALGLEFLDRRAAAALVLISGAGISLYARGVWTRDRHRDLLRRGLFLILAGTLLSLIWSGDILHVYGVLICLGAFLVRSSGRLLAVTGLACLAFGGLRWTPLFDFIEEGGSWIWEAAADLLFTGYFPLFPWAAVFTAGMLLGRLEPAGGKQAVWLWGAAVTAFFTGEGLALMIPGDWARPDLSLPTLTGMVSGMGSGLCLILSAAWAAGRLGRNRVLNRAAGLVVAVGRTSLSFYILHIVFLVSLSPLAGRDGIPDLVRLSLGAVLFYLIYAVLAVRWLTLAGRGPFELAMRRFPFIRNSPRRSVLSGQVLRPARRL